MRWLVLVFLGVLLQPASAQGQRCLECGRRNDVPKHDPVKHQVLKVEKNKVTLAEANALRFHTNYSIVLPSGKTIGKITVLDTDLNTNIGHGLIIEGRAQVGATAEDK